MSRQSTTTAPVTITTFDHDGLSIRDNNPIQLPSHLEWKNSKNIPARPHLNNQKGSSDCIVNNNISSSSHIYFHRKSSPFTFNWHSVYLFSSYSDFPIQLLSIKMRNRALFKSPFDFELFVAHGKGNKYCIDQKFRYRYFLLLLSIGEFLLRDKRNEI